MKEHSSAFSRAKITKEGTRRQGHSLDSFPYDDTQALAHFPWEKSSSLLSLPAWGTHLLGMRGQRHCQDQGCCLLWPTKGLPRPNSATQWQHAGSSASLQPPESTEKPPKLLQLFIWPPASAHRNFGSDADVRFLPHLVIFNPGQFGDSHSSAPQTVVPTTQVEWYTAARVEKSWLQRTQCPNLHPPLPPCPFALCVSGLQPLSTSERTFP